MSQLIGQNGTQPTIEDIINYLNNLTSFDSNIGAFVNRKNGNKYLAQPIPSWVKNFYTADSVINGKLIDSIGGAHLHQTTNTPKQITNYVSHTANGPTGAMVGDKAPDTLASGKSFFALAVWADGGAGAFGIQNGNGGIPGVASFELFRNSTFSTSYIDSGNGSPVTSTLATGVASATPTGVGLLYNAVAQTVTFFEITTAGATVYTPITMAAVIGNFLPFGANYQSFGGTAGNGIAKLYGFVIGHFTTPPADYLDAAGWMTANWVSGRKDLYPGWANLS